jgi:hypothetical protein
MAQNFLPWDRDQAQAPDHATIARFRRRHEDALRGLFSDVLALCQKAGLVRSGTLALDSTKLHATRANVTSDEIAREILEEAAATDAAEDELYGERRGDELRARLDSDEGRALYRKRQRMIEPIFGQTKANRGIDRFLCRGLGACRAEWRLITATHNLLKAWRHGLAAA